MDASFCYYTVVALYLQFVCLKFHSTITTKYEIMNAFFGQNLTRFIGKLILARFD